MTEPQELELWRYLQSQRELAARLIEGDSLEQVAPRFLEIVADLLRWEAGAMWEVTGEGEPLRLVAGWSTPDLDARPLWRRSRELNFHRGTGLPGDAWDTGRIALAPDYRDYPTTAPRYEVSAQLGLEAALAIPVPLGDPKDVLAVAEFHTLSFEAQSQELLALLTGFADQLGTFIARRRAEAKSAEAERFRQHLAEVVRGTQDAVLSKDLDGIVTSWNPAAARLYGYTAEEAIGRHVSFIVPSDHKDEEMVILDRVKRGERLDTYETERIRADGARISVSLTVSPIRSPMRGLIGASVVARDITAQMRRRRAQEFLVAASRLLDTSLDPEETARTIVSTAVPELAELCLIDFRRADGWYGDSIVAGADPEMAARLEQIRRAQPLDPGGEHPVAQVLRLNQPMIWRDLKAPEVVDKVSQGEDHLQLMRDAGYNSAAVVPLVARGRTLGALSFLHAHGDLRYDPGDLDFLSELGDRAALALDNARLYRERDRVAKSLQRGLRPPRPADVEGLDVSVVFEAAGEGIEIGGDLYDVLPSDNGCWVLVGDVAGKGSTAASVSVAVRHSVRGLTREIGEPDEVLRRVNELLLAGDSLNDFATAMLACLRREDSGWAITLASAGHPPAVLTGPDGPELLGGGTVLGAWEEANVELHERRLEPGATLALCTDGWLEAGPVTTHQGPETFAEMTQALAGLELDELTERLRADAVTRSSGTLRDDLVVLAVRPRATSDEAEAPRELAVGAN
ncbi:MAG TPA: SpoIIE family protein phosphatase [Solirubrobacterales bacterium]|nr:SpoIIE family protein phosphatase [Solirubrobacterales bacterium]